MNTQTFLYPGQDMFPTVETDPKRVNCVGLDYLAMLPGWTMIDDLQSTDAMRRAGPRWLAAEEKENELAYRARLGRSFLYPATKDTLRKMVARPFARDVQVKGELPPALAPMLDNVDLCGSTLTQFAKRFFQAAVQYGHSSVFVDYPRVPAQGRTLADETQGKLRPYFIPVIPANLLGHEEARLLNGEERLTRIRMRTTRSARDGEFGTKCEEVVRVWDSPAHDELTGKPIEGQKGSWSEYVQAKGEGEFKLDPTRTSIAHSFPGVPLATMYAEKTGLLRSRLYLEQLAWVNVAHWQSQSDQRNLLRYARVPSLAFFGVTDEDMATVVIAGMNVWRFRDADSRAEFIEHSGKALEAGAADLEHLEEQMVVLGAQPFQRRRDGGGDVKATVRVADEQRNDASIWDLIRACENALLEAFRMAAQWVGAELPKDFGIEIFSDFSAEEMGVAHATVLKETRANGDLSRKTYLEELQRVGVLSTGVDIEKELQAVEKEEELKPPELALFPAPGGPPRPGAPGAPPKPAPAAKPPPADDEDDEAA